MKMMQNIFGVVVFVSVVQIASFQETVYKDNSSDFVITTTMDAIHEYLDESSGMDPVFIMPVDKAIITIYVIITVIGLIANAVVFFVIFAGNETGKTVTAIYILQLTVADTIFLVCLPMFSMQKVLGKWIFSSWFCTLCQTIKYMNYYAGMFFLMAMSVDRYIAVAYSTRPTQIRTKKRTYIACFCMWIAALLMSIPAMMYAKTSEGNSSFCKVLFPGSIQLIEDDYYYYSASGDLNGTGDSNISEIADNICDSYAKGINYESWLIVEFVVAFVIPFSVIVASYVKILTHLKTSETKIGHTATNKAATTRKRVTRMVAALVICFTVCWLPHHLFVLARIKGIPTTVPICLVTDEFFIALAFSNSAINPILYTFMGNNFRGRFRKSVKNTQIAMKRRSSRRSSSKRRSMNSHSDQNQKKTARLLVHYRKESGMKQANGKTQNEISLIGSQGKSFGDGDCRPDSCAASSVGEQTLVTRMT